MRRGFQMNPFVSNSNKLRRTFENVQNLTDDGIFSKTLSINGVNWKFKIRTMTNTKKYLAVYLYHVLSEINEEKNWIREVDVKYRLLNQSGNQKDLVKVENICFKHDLKNWGYHQFIEWDKLLSPNNGYIENDSIVVEIEFDFKYYDFSKKIPNFTDIIVHVEETDFHVNRWVLCSKSGYFFDLFVNKKKEDIVIKLDDIKAIDFCYILASLDTFFDGVNDKNYVELMKIAKKFTVSTLDYKCEQFLITYTGIPLIDKIKYAEDNEYEKLMKSCIESLKTGADIKKLHNSVKFSALKETSKLRIMQRFLDIY